MFVRICNPHALNIGICNPEITALFVRICNPHASNIGICNPEKLSFRITNAYILFRRIANPTERPRVLQLKIAYPTERPQGYINKNTGLYHQPNRVLQTRAKGFGGTMWRAEFEAVHCVPDDHCERTLAVHPHAMLHSRLN